MFVLLQTVKLTKLKYSSSLTLALVFLKLFHQTQVTLTVLVCPLVEDYNYFESAGKKDYFPPA